jgi:hypothetical protein
MKIVLFMMHFNFAFNCLKIWNGQSEGINTTQRKKTKGQTVIYKTLHRK